MKPVNKWLITISVMLPTIMEIIDTSVANVALPHMQGSLNAGTDEVTWVLTSYLVSNAIVLPMTGWLARLFGRKRFLLTCIVLFTLSSFLCGAAPNLGMLIFFRVLQGAAGGAAHFRDLIRERGVHGEVLRVAQTLFAPAHDLRDFQLVYRRDVLECGCLVGG